MKQLKVIANEYNNENGLMTVNFNEQILVRPGSKIAMDKFSMDVTQKGITSDIVLAAQNISVNCDVETQSPRIVSIDAGTYSTVSDILEEWNQSANSILETSMLITNQDIPDNGLYFGSDLEDVTNKVQLLWGGCPMDTLDATNTSLEGVTIDASGTFIPTIPASGVSNWVIDTNVPIIRGGVDIRYRLKDINVYDPNNYSQYSIGLVETLNSTDLVYGISRLAGLFYIVNLGSEIEIDDYTAFLNSSYIHQFFVDAGELRFQIVDPSDDSQKFITPTGSFSGFDFNTSYFFNFYGSFAANGSGVVPPEFIASEVIFQTNITQLNTGFTYDMASFIQKNHLYMVGIPGVLDRTVLINFEDCPTLQEGLGFRSISYGNQNPQPNDVYTAEELPSFQIYYDLALDIPSIQLESYIASTNKGVGALSGRKNYLCYFVPQRVEGNRLIYAFNSTKLDFVDLSLRDSIDLNSIQFRVVFPASPQSVLNVQNLSFNLYIQEPPSL